MQLMIDINVETPAGLRLAAQFLIDHAALREALERGEVPAGTLTPPPPPPPPPSSVVPFAPPAPSAAAPSAIPPVPPAAPSPPASLAPIAPSAPVPAAPSATAVSADEHDSAGIPWDARIHQKGKSKKKDKTWKLQKGIAEATVAAVLQELTAQGRVRAAAGEVPAPPSFPGSVPVPPVSGSMPAPLPPGAMSAPGVATDGGIPAPSVNFPGSAVPVPPAPVLGVPAPGVVQVGFRELVQKISAARNANRITAEEVNQCVAAAGVPNLQALSALAHKVPEVDANVDMILATR